MDAMKLLGLLMKNKSLASGLGSGLLGGLLGGGKEEQPQQSASPLGGIMGLLGGGGGGGPAGGGIGGLLGGLLGGGGGQEQTPAAVAPAPQQAQDQATVMIQAMINAAKSDGRVDQSEVDNILGRLGDVSEEEANFLREEFQKPLDVKGFANTVPKGMEQQVYALSLTSIELDTQNEAQYLADLGQNLQLTPQLCNQIHEKLGAPTIFG